MVDYSKLMDTEISVSDDEIKALANLSHKTTASIIEDKNGKKFIMSIQYDKNNLETIIASDNYDTYKEMSTNFFKKFIKFGGNIKLSEVFIDE